MCYEVWAQVDEGAATTCEANTHTFGSLSLPESNAVIYAFWKVEMGLRGARPLLLGQVKGCKVFPLWWLKG